MQARICYKEKSLTFRYDVITVHKMLEHLPGSGSEAPQDRRVDRLIFSARTETIVRLPLSVESLFKDRLV
jgi:hypothetical protein